MRYLAAAIEVDATGVIIGQTTGFVPTTATPASSVYPFTLSPDIDAADITCFAIPTGAVAAQASPGQVNVNDRTISVSTFTDAGAASPFGFHLVCFQKWDRGALLVGDGGVGRLHASGEVALEPVPGNYVGKHPGFAPTVIVAASIFDLTLSEAIDPNNSALVVTPVNPAVPASYITVLSRTDTLIRIATFNAAGGAANAAFSIDVWRKGIH